MLHHSLARNDHSSRLAQNWLHKVSLSEKFFTYRNEIISVLAELHLIWNEHPGCISVARHCFDFVCDRTQPVQSLKTKLDHGAVSSRTEFKKMFSQKMVELPQLEWPAPTIFVLQKDRTSLFGAGYRGLNVLTKRVSFSFEDCSFTESVFTFVLLRYLMRASASYQIP